MKSLSLIIISSFLISTAHAQQVADTIQKRLTEIDTEIALNKGAIDKLQAEKDALLNDSTATEVLSQTEYVQTLQAAQAVDVKPVAEPPISAQPATVDNSVNGV